MIDYSTSEALDAPLSDGWLIWAGFKWHQLERQPEKHWLLWLGDCVDGGFTSYEDLGVEVAPGSYRGRDTPNGWFCWLRSDDSHRYHRFIHIRTITRPRDLSRIIWALSGQEHDPALCRNGSMMTPERAEWHRREDQRLDRIFRRSSHPWSNIEADETRGGALPEHLELAVKSGLAK